MKIESLEVRACLETRRGQGVRLRGAAVQLAYIVVTLRTDEGISGTSLGFGGRRPEAAAHIASVARDLLLGRAPLERLGVWREYRRLDRWWNLFPIWAYGPIDVALWDIAGKAAGLSLRDLIGWCRTEVPTYASSLVLDDLDEYVEEALAVKARGLHGYKVHPPGPVSRDLAVYAAVREAVGDHFALMADPVAAYSYEEALRVGRALERLGYEWFEEPLPDNDVMGLRRLSAALEIPVVGTETLGGAPQVISDYLARGVVDVVRGDVSWSGGITGLLKIAAIAEGFGARCEVHTAIYHPLEVANLHALCAIPNATYFELLWPLDPYRASLATPLDIDDKGMARPPTGPGLGMELDWERIEGSTVLIT